MTMMKVVAPLAALLHVTIGKNQDAKDLVDDMVRARDTTVERTNFI